MIHAIGTRARLQRRRLGAIVVPAFLMAHLFCLCLPATATVTPRSVQMGAHHDGDHDCCPRESGKAPRPAHAPSCAHCGGVQLGVTPGAPVLAPTLLVTAVALPPGPSKVAAALHTARSTRASRGSPPEAPPLRRTCVLIV